MQRSVPKVVLQIGSTSIGEQQSTALVVSRLTITITKVDSTGCVQSGIFSISIHFPKEYLTAEMQRGEPTPVLHVQVGALLAQQLQGEAVPRP